MSRAALGAFPLLLAAALPAQERALALIGARIHAVSKPEIERGVLLIAGDKIAAVGDQGLHVPAGAMVIDCTGKVITPGLIDAATTLGVLPRDQNEQGSEVTPQVRIVDAIDPRDRAFARARRQGVTAVQVTPGSRNVIGGLGAVLRTAGSGITEMLLRDESCLRLTLGSEPSSGNRAFRGGVPDSIYYRRPTTRMGVVWEARKAFHDARAYREQRTLGRPDAPLPQDPALDVLLRALDGKLVVRTTAAAEQDIRTALRLADELGYTTVIDEATEAWRVLDVLQAARVTIVLGAPSAEVGQDDAQPRAYTVKALADAGVPFAIATGARVGALSLAHEAMLAVRNGLPKAAALAAITATPARILGVGERIGTLEAGKDADLVVWSGDPFDPTSVVEQVYVQGAEVQ